MNLLVPDQLVPMRLGQAQQFIAFGLAGLEDGLRQRPSSRKVTK